LREAKKLQKDASLADERRGKVACFNKKEDNSPPPPPKKKKEKEKRKQYIILQPRILI
jgi:hypothetical protein